MEAEGLFAPGPKEARPGSGQETRRRESRRGAIPSRWGSSQRRSEGNKHLHTTLPTPSSVCCGSLLAEPNRSSRAQEEADVVQTNRPTRAQWTAALEGRRGQGEQEMDFYLRASLSEFVKSEC